MPEYRIVTKIDPQTAPGAAKTKQDLQGIKTTADAVNRSIETGTNRSMGAATKSTGEFTKALDQNARGMQRAKGLYSDLGLSVNDLTGKILNGARGMRELGAAAGGGAGGAGGGPPSATGGISLLRGAASVAAGFIGGAFAIAVAAGAAAVVDLAIKAIKGKDSIEDKVEALKKNYAELRLNNEAERTFALTIEGVTKAMEENEKAVRALETSHRTAAQSASIAAQARVLEREDIRKQTVAQLELAKAYIATARAQLYSSGVGEEGKFQRLAGGMALDRAEASVRELEATLGKQDRLIEQAEARRVRARAQREAELGKQQATAAGRINADFDRQIVLATQTATAEDVLNGKLRERVKLLEQERDRQLEAARAAEKKIKVESDGVARFRTRQQAIGLAGNELLRQGLRVGENEQFGGVKFNHPGMGNAAHGKYAIDVNAPGNVIEANVPNLKAKFDQLARSYQKRGYRVLWAGHVYEAGGNGPSGPIRGTNKHYDHMHLEAPGTIVGKATQSSLAASEASAMRSEERIAERASDFVDRVVDKAAAVGLPDNRVTALQSEITRTLEDFERQFNRRATAAEEGAMVGALTAAEARSQAEHFREAYQYPLEDQQIALEHVGLQREIYNRILDETRIKGEPLTEQERQMIENAVMMGDKYDRMRVILEGLNTPLETYRQTIAALNTLLGEGRISQERYNAEVANLQTNARNLLGGVQGTDPLTGQSFEDQAARAEEQARYANQLADFQQYRQQLLDMGVNYDALMEAAHRNHVAKLNAMDAARKSLALNSAQSTAESLANIAETVAGKQSAVYKAMFIAAKAFAIADAIIKIQQGIANALALPWPANMAAIASVAAAAASIVSSIQAVSLNLADGGMVRGPGGPRDDRIPANLSDGEFVVNAAATSRNRALLEAINNGGVVHRQKVANDNLRSTENIGGDSYAMHFGDVIVQAGNATAQDSKEIGREVKTAITTIVRDEIAKESRPGGRMTRTRQSVLG